MPERVVRREGILVVEHVAVCERVVVNNGISIHDCLAVYEAVVVDKRVRMGDVGVVIENQCSTPPVESPMMPAPSKSTEEADRESECESETRSCQIESGIGIPAGPDRHDRPVNQPGIILRYINDVGFGWFNDDRLSLAFTVCCGVLFKFPACCAWRRIACTASMTCWGWFT